MVWHSRTCPRAVADDSPARFTADPKVRLCINSQLLEIFLIRGIHGDEPKLDALARRNSHKQFPLMCRKP